MTNPSFHISEIKTEDRPLVVSFIPDRWGSPMIVSRGKMFNATELPGFINKLDNKVVGLITYHISGKDCEIVTLDSKVKNLGLGTRLLNEIIKKARLNGCKRVWLITTNDNTKAIRFYQKRGFDCVGFYKDSILESRKLKPEIPEFGNDNIPIRHEIEFEFRIM